MRWSVFVLVLTACGSAVVPTSVCGPSSCAGCCSPAGECLDGTLAAACGLGGVTCSDCGTRACVINFCAPEPAPPGEPLDAGEATVDAGSSVVDAGTSPPCPPIFTSLTLPGGNWRLASTEGLQATATERGLSAAFFDDPSGPAPASLGIQFTHRPFAETATYVPGSCFDVFSTADQLCVRYFECEGGATTQDCPTGLGRWFRATEGAVVIYEANGSPTGGHFGGSLHSLLFREVDGTGAVRVDGACRVMAFDSVDFDATW